MSKSIERWDLVGNVLQDGGELSAQEVAQVAGCSLSTARKDLREWVKRERLDVRKDGRRNLYKLRVRVYDLLLDGGAWEVEPIEAVESAWNPNPAPAPAPAPAQAPDPDSASEPKPSARMRTKARHVAYQGCGGPCILTLLMIVDLISGLMTAVIDGVAS